MFTNSKSVHFILVLFLLWAVTFLFLGCGDDDDGENTHLGEDAHAYMITMEPPGHIHAFSEKALTFKVTTEAEAPVTGLSPIVAYQFQGAEQARETQEGDIVDNGDGTYTWKRTFNDVGVHVLSFKFMHDGMMYSNSFPLETSKPGGERIFCPSKDNPEFAYQIRWEAIPGHIHAGDEVTFRIELMRSINEKIDTEKPWLNQFDHLSPYDLKPVNSMPEVAIGSANGEESVTAEYKGRGIYEVKHKFGHISEKTTYWLHVTFEDECGTVDESGEAEHDYQFPVSPAH